MRPRTLRRRHIARFGDFPVAGRGIAATHNGLSPEESGGDVGQNRPGTPLGAAVTGYAIAKAGFGPTYAAVAAGMTLATVLLAMSVYRVERLPEAAPVLTPS